MNIYIKKEGQRQGPYSTQQVGALIRKGEYLMNDLAWREGMADWKPIHSIEDIVEAALPPEPNKELKQTEQPSPAAIPIQSLASEPKPGTSWILFLVGLVGFIGLCIGLREADVFTHIIGCNSESVAYYAISFIFGVIGAGIPILICRTIIRFFRRRNVARKLDEHEDAEVHQPQTKSLLKCSYCGAQYPEGTIICPQDETPLSSNPSEGKREGTDSWSLTKVLLCAGLLLAIAWCYFNISDPTSKTMLMRLITAIFSRGHLHE